MKRHNRSQQRIGLPYWPWFRQSALLGMALAVSWQVLGDRPAWSAEIIASPPIAVGKAAIPMPSTLVPAALEKSLEKSVVDRAFADGVYLYGQVPQPDQIGHAYMVFEVKSGQVTGAFYMPSSSFDCFEGRFEAGKLAMTIRDSYDQTTSSYSIALKPSTVASNQVGSEDLAMGLEGLYALEEVSANDRRILEVCKTVF